MSEIKERSPQKFDKIFHLCFEPLSKKKQFSFNKKELQAREVAPKIQSQQQILNSNVS